ncbi:MAG: right-handed parallel beta-helix repeat-containing protein [Bacillota bacterium]|nr:right-handed parallel beta-helix repeat-containing protein [Bacillota bacterium]MDD4263940.1 right-handed parallel beta-helix repeat-containing protein [Bacillota bacterium]
MKLPRVSKWLILSVIVALSLSGCLGLGGDQAYVATIVVKEGTNPLAGVSVVYTGDVSGTGTTNANGQISLSGLKGTITVNFVLENYTFSSLTISKAGTYNVVATAVEDSEINTEIKLLADLADVEKDQILLGDTITLTQPLVISREVTISGQGYKLVGNVKIDKPNVIIENVEIDGNLEAGTGVGEGDVTLRNVTVKGTSQFNGGGSNSVHLLGSTRLVGEVTLNKAGLALRIEGTATVEGLVRILKGASLIAPQSSDVFKSEVVIDTDMTVAILSPLGELSTLRILRGATVQIGLDIAVSTVVIEANVTDVEFVNEGTIQKYEVGDNSQVDYEGNPPIETNEPLKMNIEIFDPGAISVRLSQAFTLENFHFGAQMTVDNSDFYFNVFPVEDDEIVLYLMPMLILGEPTAYQVDFALNGGAGRYLAVLYQNQIDGIDFSKETEEIIEQMAVIDAVEFELDWGSLPKAFIHDDSNVGYEGLFAHIRQRTTDDIFDEGELLAGLEPDHLRLFTFDGWEIPYIVGEPWYGGYYQLLPEEDGFTDSHYYLRVNHPDYVPEIRMLFNQNPNPYPVHNVTQAKGYTTIQNAIDAANDGDEIVIAAHKIYTESLVIEGKSIHLRSEEPSVYDKVTSTIIMPDSETDGSVLKIVGPNTNGTIIDGLSFQGGTGELHDDYRRYGGGVYIRESNAIVRNCIISFNTASGGGGVYMLRSDAQILNNHIEGNFVQSGALGGGGIFVEDSSGLIEGNTIVNNLAPSYGSNILVSGNGLLMLFIKDNVINDSSQQLDLPYGGGIAIKDGITLGIEFASVIVDNNEIATNHGSGIFIYDSLAVITNNEISNNTAIRGSAIMLWNNSAAVIDNNEISSNTATSECAGIWVDWNANVYTLNHELWPRRNNPAGVLEQDTNRYFGNVDDGSTIPDGVNLYFND